MRPLLSLLVLLLFSCKKTDNLSNTNTNVETINAQYFIKWNYPYATGANLLATSMIAYDNNSPIKRSGSYLPVFGGYDLNSYTNQVYDEVIKVNNQMLLLQSKNKLPSGSPNLPKWEVEFNDNMPIKRICYIYYLGNYVSADTALYYYDTNKRVQKIEFHNSAQGVSYLFTKTFFFNNNNLQKISGIYLKKPNTVLFSTEEIFGSYDNKANTLKGLWLWDDLYDRSLSSNNFSTYTYKRFDAQNNLIDSTHRSWNLQYDGKGDVSFK